VSLKHISVLLKPLNNGTAAYGDNGSALLKTSNVFLLIGVICQCRQVSPQESKGGRNSSLHSWTREVAGQKVLHRFSSATVNGLLLSVHVRRKVRDFVGVDSVANANVNTKFAGSCKSEASTSRGDVVTTGNEILAHMTRPPSWCVKIDAWGTVRLFEQ